MAEPVTPPEVIAHYEERFDESIRLDADPVSTIEAIRTLELLERFLPEAPARIIDIGGGPGYYARRFTARGHEVHLVDPVPRHVESARSGDESGPAPASASIGDARALDHPDAGFDAALLLGPLYHLVERDDRVGALAEARRVVRPGGFVAAAAISRFAAAIDGLVSGYVDDPRFREMVRRGLTDGRHRNETGDPQYFTTAYFHRPAELVDDMAGAGLSDVEVFAIEGIAWATADLADRVGDVERLEAVLGVVRATEQEPDLLAVSPHLLAIGRF